MKKIANLLRGSSLIVRIVIGLVAGIASGMWLPNIRIISALGDIFVGALKAIAPILVFTLVISSLSNAGSGLGKRFGNVIAFYTVSTFFAAIVAVGISFIFRIEIPLEGMASQSALQELDEVFGIITSNVVMNPFKAITEANYMGILTWSVVLGIALKNVSSDKTKAVLKDISEAVSKSVSYVISFAPLGIFGIVYNSVNEYGLEIFKDYGKLLVVLVGCMLFVLLVVNPLIAAIALKRNPYPLLFKCIKESGITAFFTRSSAANIPVNMRLCEKLGLDREYYGVAVPLGATINMNGAAITITVMSLSAAFSAGADVDFFSAVILSLVATLGACGASGVAGGSLLLVPMACSLLNVSQDIAMQVVSAGFVIGIVQDSLETALNSSGDVFFCATAEFMEWRKSGRNLPF